MVRQFAGRVRRPGAGSPTRSRHRPKRCSSISTSHPGDPKLGEDLRSGFRVECNEPRKIGRLSPPRSAFFLISGRTGADLGTRRPNEAGREERTDGSSRQPSFADITWLRNQLRPVA